MIYLKRLDCFCIIFLVTIALHPDRAEAQQQSILRVLVYSGEDGNPLVGANVLLYQPDQGQFEDTFRYGGSTNGSGFVEFREVVSGGYQLKISYIGYETYEETINLTYRDISVMELTLQPKVGQLEQLLVEAERDVAVGEVGLRKISPEEIARVPTPGPGGDLASYLQTLPGVVMSGSRGGELHIRGGAPMQNLVLVDMLPVIKPFHISNLFSAFPSTIIQSVDVYAGGFGAKYMGATSGVIDVHLRPGNMKQYRASGSLGSHLATLNVEGPVVSGQSSFIVSGRKSIIDQTDIYLIDEEIPIDFYDVTARYTFHPFDYSCNLTGLRTFDQGQINPAINNRLSWSNTVVGATCLSYDRKLNYPFKVTIGYSRYRNSESSPVREARSSSLTQIFFKFNSDYEIFGQPVHYALAGYHQNYDTKLNDLFSDFESFNITRATAHSSVSTVWNLSKRLTVEPSLGLQLILTRVTLEPRLRVSYQPKNRDDYEISIALGKYNQGFSGVTDPRDAGTVFTVLKPIGDSGRLPSALHGLVGFNANINPSLEVNLEGYVIKRENIPVAKWTPFATIETETVPANGFTHGFDARLIYDNRSFYLTLSYGWAKTKYKAATDNLGAWLGGEVFSYYPPHDRRHIFTAVGSYTFAGFTAGASWRFSSGKPYTRVYGYDLALNYPFRYPVEFPTTDPGKARALFSEPYGGRLPAFHRLDVSLERSFRLSPAFKLNAEAGVINAYNRKNIFYFDATRLQRVYQTPWLPYFTLQAQFNP